MRSILLSQPKVAAVADLVDEANRRAIPVYVAGPGLLELVVGFPVHRGVLALAPRPVPAEAEQVVGQAGLSGAPLVVVEAVNDHENLGALFRNAAVLGAGAVLLDPSCCDPLYRRAVRVSLGHVVSVPFARLDSWPDQLQLLTEAGYRLLALAPDGATDIDEAEVRHADRIAILVGAEGPGLTASARTRADWSVRIPMATPGDSLNVATAAAIALHILRRPGVP